MSNEVQRISEYEKLHNKAQAIKNLSTPSIKPKLKSQSLRHISQTQKKVSIKDDFAKMQGKNHKLEVIQYSNPSQRLKKTNIEFENRKSRGKNEGLLWTSQSWMPFNTTTNSMLRRKSISKPLYQQDFHQPKEPLLSDKTEKRYEARDTQTILRKNSLFLLNFIRTRERKQTQTPHIGELPAVTEKHIESESNKHTERIKRERDFEERRKFLENENKERKVIEKPFYPEPW